MKKFWAVFIIVVLIISMFPAAVFAEGVATNLHLLHEESVAVGFAPEESGTQTTLTVSAENDDPVNYPLTYEWHFVPADVLDGEDTIIENATGASVDITVTPDTAGTYYCQIYDGQESVYHEIRVFFDTGLEWAAFLKN